MSLSGRCSSVHLLPRQIIRRPAPVALYTPEVQVISEAANVLLWPQTLIRLGEQNDAGGECLA
ncbi:hypothetical protein E2C01_064875 [Portunus trituberculatus]|uniref:Uncharacterized protein n=1 Tax=Portunus trituberculatus TaxID=210409 RepID=A0A5B7HD13_PORTR|nr:hypothetical protein [Portunus trituberculatus]